MNDKKQVRDALSGLLAEKNYWAKRFLAQMDFLERPAEAATAKATEDGFRVKLPAHGIASVLVRFRAPMD